MGESTYAFLFLTAATQTWKRSAHLASFNFQASLAPLVPLYIAAITALMLASAIWFYLRRDFIGMAACLIIAGLATVCVAG